MTEPIEPTPAVCAVCARILDARSYKDGAVEYVHTEQDRKDEDHPAVPVMPDEIHASYRCDFCNTEVPKYRLPAKAFEIGPGVMSGQDWACCATCWVFIEMNQWNGLVRHVVAGWEARYGEPMAEEAQAALKTLYGRLRKNITGKVRPF